MTLARSTRPNVVPDEQWFRAHAAHLEREKQFTRMRDELARQRRQLPWRKVQKAYVFDTTAGKRTLSELFDGRSQLLVKHFMFGPGWQEGCVGCSFEADHIGGALDHLEHHDVSYVAVARAPLAEFLPFKKRMGWKFQWVSSYGTDFNYDFHVTATPEELAQGRCTTNYALRDSRMEEVSGHSVFYKGADGEVYHTFSAFGRGAEELLSTYVVLDMMPTGRNENGPRYNLTDWVRHHDKYDADGAVDSTGRFRAASESSCGCGASREGK